MSELIVRDLSVRYGDLQILDRVSFTAPPGGWLMIIGPNGAGKSTIINAVSRSIPSGGTVLIDGKSLSAYRSRELARKIGVLAQNHYVGYDFTVEEVVGLGRYAYHSGLSAAGRSEADEAITEAALEKTGLTRYRHQSVKNLSGGELQRTFLAQLFAQDPDILLLDEPSNHLDPVYQKQIFAIVREWLSQGHRTVVSAMHDLSLARAFGTHGLLLRSGHVIAAGPIEEVCTPAALADVYGMDVSAWMRQIHGCWFQKPDADRNFPDGKISVGRWRP